jgi:hypothetical protein
MAGDQVARSNVNPFPIVNRVWLAICHISLQASVKGRSAPQGLASSHSSKRLLLRLFFLCYVVTPFPSRHDQTTHL